MSSRWYRHAPALFTFGLLTLAVPHRSPAFTPINPIIQTIYSADPAPFVWNDTVYLYTGHDEDRSRYFTMNDWHVFASKDMVNWTDLGSPLSIADFTWVKSDAWAGQAIERDGKFFWYVPMNQKSGGMAIGVAVGDGPVGPFKDALGKPLVFDHSGDIDPTVFIDKDSQAYLAWGNPVYKYVKLNRDMISFDPQVGDQGIVRSAMTVAEFGRRADDKRSSSYEEGPWLYRRNDIYYNIFAAGPIPEHLAYSTAPSPQGPWRFGGIIMQTQEGSAFTNHPGVVDFKGRTFLFYHNARLPGGGGFDRSVSVEELHFNPDGSIQPAAMTSNGPDPVATLDPYRRTEAETIAWESGIRIVTADQAGLAVTPLNDGAYLEVCAVDFGRHTPHRFSASIRKTDATKASLELHLDRLDGPVFTTLDATSTRAEWRTANARTTAATGVHNVFFVFRTSDRAAAPSLSVDWWRFE